MTPNKAYDYEDDKKEMGHRALLTEFAPRQYQRVLNYPMINKNALDPRSLSHGFWIIYKQYKYWEEPRKQPCKACNYTSPAWQGHG
jgi:hypothetical protein